MVYDPASASNSTPTVFVDAGHGGLDHGTSGQTSNATPIAEKDAALATVLRLKDLLLRAGDRVVLSRSRDSSVARLSPSEITGTTYTLAGDHHDIRARVNCANQSRADLLISVHFNAFTDSSVGGTATYFDPDRPFASANERLARLVQNGLLKGWKSAGLTIPDRGVTADTGGSGAALSAEASAYGHLYLLGPRRRGFNDAPSRMPGVLTEPLFLTDPPEADLAASARGQSIIARALAGAAERWLAKRERNS